MKKLLICLLAGIAAHYSAAAQTLLINNNSAEKKLVFGTDKIRATLDYHKKAAITLLEVGGQQVLKEGEGLYTSISTKEAVYSTLQADTDPVLQITGQQIRLSGIVYGDKTLGIRENWTFSLHKGILRWTIDRTLSKSIIAEQVKLPVFIFNNMQTWEGAFQDYGGIAWFYLFNKKLDTYGVHTSSSRFWNSKTGNGLLVAVTAAGQQVAMDYCRTKDDNLACTVALSGNEMAYRYDSGTYRRRFLRDQTNVWAPIAMPAGSSQEAVELSYFNAAAALNRGNMKGVNGAEVSAVLNTVARIGVIDKQHFGGNSWHTPYGPICLHEQYIAQMGLGINDSNYLKGYSECLDYYRDNAIKPDGRVWARWAYTNEDMMPGEVTSKGFYEAQWGYLLDANPDYVTNVAGLYDQTGNTRWVKRHQLSCERALDWMLQRDSNNNGLVEMINSSLTQKKGSDWLDIIWASYENAFVNVKLYHALIVWAAIEKQLGNQTKALYYQNFAAKLKNTFNKPVTDGGCWDEEKKCYIHWREKDNSIHGNNMVTPVNFMAITYGICDNDDRKKLILDGIEQQMQKEDLFFWPVCMYSYNTGEGNDWQFPFPNYENGDIFLSWGSIGVSAYASYKPELAVKYVNNVLARYAKDGLAFQRYGRAKQDGLGDDILSGNSLSVVGLYQAVYGINPRYNRFYLEPHMPDALAGTQLNYNFRGQQLFVELNRNLYAVANKVFKIIAPSAFGFFSKDHELQYFNGGAEQASLTIKSSLRSSLALEIKEWVPGKMEWVQFAAGKSGQLEYTVHDLNKNSRYRILVNDKLLKHATARADGSLQFTAVCTQVPAAIRVMKN